MLLSKCSIVLASSVYMLCNFVMSSVWQRGQPDECPGLQAAAVELQTRCQEPTKGDSSNS